MGKTNLVTRVRWEVARAFAFLPQPATVVVAVSGGADSMCLADACVALHMQPVIAHLNHQLRGDAAQADAEFVLAYAQRVGVRCHIGSVDVGAQAQVKSQSIELAAREARYAFLADTCTQFGSVALATAHHADDQAETVLMRLLRGTGVSGLRGMQATSPLIGHEHICLVRPLLRIGKKEIEQYCADEQLPTRHDVSNDDTAHTRNKIRHQLLPYLAQFNPNISQALARLADSANSDADVIAFGAQAAFAQVATRTGNTIAFDRAAWQALPTGVQRAMLREAMRQLLGETTNLKYAAIEEARDVLNSNATIGEIGLRENVRVRVQAKVFAVFLTTQ